MTIIPIIDRHQKDVMKQTMKHSELWNEDDPPPWITLFVAEVELSEEVTVDPSFFDIIA